jgi:type I restriction enzyme M protein
MLNDLLFDKLPKQHSFEAELWAAADNLRANAKLKPSEYSAPVFGLLFLRYAFVKFQAVSVKIEAEYEAQTGRNIRTIEEMYVSECGFYLPEVARYDYLLKLDKTLLAQKAVVDAVIAFDKANPDLEKILPQNEFLKIPDATLRELIESLATLQMNDGDQFGKIYEYFLSKFSALKAEKGGEFYTPQSIVKLIVEVLEPHEGRIFDPACGTGGMFIQSAKFIQSHQERPDIAIFGQEKEPETAKIAKLNLTINGLRNEIKEVDTSLSAATYHADHFPVAQHFDYVMANPPFNVDGVKVAEVGNHPLFNEYGLPLSSSKSAKKSNDDGTFSNANYLWVSLFATSLNENGRAGFVMANSASDARGNEAEMRQNLINEGIVDVMVAVGSNFFYTVTLPVTLWFFDKAKTRDAARKDKTLFIDARKIFNQVTRAHREFTHAQLQNIAAIVWLYRGEKGKFLALRQQYLQATAAWKEGGIVETGEGILSESDTYESLQDYEKAVIIALQQFAKNTLIWLDATELEADAAEALKNNIDFEKNLEKMAQVADFQDKKAINDWYKMAEEAASFIEKNLKPNKDKTFGKADIKTALRLLADARKRWAFVADRVAYFETQLAWLDTRFPDAEWRDVEGLCKIADTTEMQAQGYSLNPGRYVGVAIEDDGMTAAEFQGFLQNQANLLQSLHHEAQNLHLDIEKDLFSLANATNLGE